MYLNPIVRGDSFYFKVSEFSDVQGRSIKSPDWQCKIFFRGGGSSLDVVANSAWEFNLTATDTNKLNVGKVFFQVFAVNVATTERLLIDSGSVEIKPNLQVADGSVDLRSDSEKLLQEVQALILKLVQNGGTIEYSIGNRRARKFDLAELRALESQLLTRVRREERAKKIKAGLPNPRNSFARF